jgi:hypothetical protein
MGPVLSAGGYDYFVYLGLALFTLFSYHFFKTAITDPGVLL